MRTRITTDDDKATANLHQGRHKHHIDDHQNKFDNNKKKHMHQTLTLEFSKLPFTAQNTTLPKKRKCIKSLLRRKLTQARGQ